MESKRVLLSKTHFHQVRLSERSIAVIAHALAVLKAAFSEEASYKEAIAQAHREIADGLETPIIAASTNTRVKPFLSE